MEEQPDSTVAPAAAPVRAREGLQLLQQQADLDYNALYPNSGLRPGFVRLPDGTAVEYYLNGCWKPAAVQCFTECTGTYTLVVSHGTLPFVPLWRVRKRQPCPLSSPTQGVASWDASHWSGGNGGWGSTQWSTQNDAWHDHAWQAWR